MSDVSFQDHINGSREKLNSERGVLLEHRNVIDEKLAEIDSEFAAIDAYEAAKTGKPSQPAKSGTERSIRRGSRREEILNIISAAPAGMSRGEIIEHLGIKGDKSGEMSVSNALMALMKTNQVYREGGKYHAPATPLQHAAE